MEESVKQIMDLYYQKKKQLDKNIVDDKNEISTKDVSRINEIDLEILTLINKKQQILHQIKSQTILSKKNDISLLENFDEIVSQYEFIISSIDDKLECLKIEKSIILCFFDKSKNNESDYILLIDLKNKTREKLLTKRTILLSKEEELKKVFVKNNQQLSYFKYKFDDYEKAINMNEWKLLYQESIKISQALEIIKVTLDLIDESIDVLKLDEKSLLYITSNNLFDGDNKLQKNKSL